MSRTLIAHVGRKNIFDNCCGGENLTGCTTRGPHAVDGPQVGDPWSKVSTNSGGSIVLIQKQSSGRVSQWNRPGRAGTRGYLGLRLVHRREPVHLEASDEWEEPFPSFGQSKIVFTGVVTPKHVRQERYRQALEINIAVARKIPAARSLPDCCGWLVLWLVGQRSRRASVQPKTCQIRLGSGY